MKNRRAILPFREGASTDSTVCVSGMSKARNVDLRHFAATDFSTGTGLIERISFASATL
jgi:hypothetical protein